MNLSPRQIITQFAHGLQQNLFPVLESAVGPLSKQLLLLAQVMSLTPLAGLLSRRGAATGRPGIEPA